MRIYYIYVYYYFLLLFVYFFLYRMDARSYNDIALNKPEVNIDIEEELIDMPFADVWLNGQKRFWHQLTEEEKYSLAEKYPARPELPYGIRTLTMISTTYEIPIDYSELANNNQAITSITHKRRDPVGFTTGVCIFVLYHIYITFYLLK